LEVFLVQSVLSPHQQLAKLLRLDAGKARVLRLGKLDIFALAQLALVGVEFLSEFLCLLLGLLDQGLPLLLLLGQGFLCLFDFGVPSLEHLLPHLVRQIGKLILDRLSN